jgi:hypothetical protein
MTLYLFDRIIAIIIEMCMRISEVRVEYYWSDIPHTAVLCNTSIAIIKDSHLIRI